MAEQVITKTCGHCKAVKPIGDFYKNKAMKGGLSNYCKVCTLDYQGEKRYKKNRIKYRLETRKKAVQYVKKYHQKNPTKTKAIQFVNNSVLAGAIPSASKMSCALCKTKAREYHHYKGYGRENWMDIIPVCRKCHNAIHGHCLR